METAGAYDDALLTVDAGYKAFYALEATFVDLYLLLVAEMAFLQRDHLHITVIDIGYVHELLHLCIGNDDGVFAAGGMALEVVVVIAQVGEIMIAIGTDKGFDFLTGATDEHQIVDGLTYVLAYGLAFDELALDFLADIEEGNIGLKPMGQYVVACLNFLAIDGSEDIPDAGLVIRWFDGYTNDRLGLKKIPPLSWERWGGKQVRFLQKSCILSLVRLRIKCIL